MARLFEEKLFPGNDFPTFQCFDDENLINLRKNFSMDWKQLAELSLIHQTNEN